MKEGDKLVATSKIGPQEKVTMAKRVSTMSYTLQGTAPGNPHCPRLPLFLLLLKRTVVDFTFYSLTPTIAALNPQPR